VSSRVETSISAVHQLLNVSLSFAVGVLGLIIVQLTTKISAAGKSAVKSYVSTHLFQSQLRGID